MKLILPGWQRGSCLVCAMWCCSFLSPSIIEASEITPFRLTGFDGALSFRHARDEVEQGTVGDVGSSSRRTSNEEEFSFLTQSYIYHPNLLQMELGAGLLLTQDETETVSGKSESDGELYSLTARLRFLDQKPYPFTLYYNRFNPSTQSGTERFVSENESYGVNASLLEPILPFSVDMEVSRNSSTGSGLTQRVNQSSDQVFLRAHRSLANGGNAQFTYHNLQQVSESGVLSQSIERNDSESESTSLSSNHIFGERNQFRFDNLFSHFTQDTLPQRQEFSWVPNLEWKHSGRATSFYRFDYTETEVNAIKSTRRSGGIGGHVALTEKWALNGEVHANDSKTVGLQNQSKGTSGAVSYTQPLSIGSLRLGVGAGYDLNENDSPEGVVSQQNERLRYDGVQRLQLARPFVEAISNVAVERNGVIIYSSVDVEDYTRVDDGALTYIDIVIKANSSDQKILIGDTLIVDYTYETGGTVSFATINNNYSAQLSLFKYYSLYASYSDTEQELKEGFSAIPLNTVQNTRVGARVDHPFAQDKYRLGVETIYEKREEEISPYTRRTVVTSFQTAVSSVTKVSLNIRRVVQDNLLSDQDSDFLSRSVTLTTRPLPRSSVRLQYSDDEDTGSAITRRVKRYEIEAQWRIRKLILSGRVSSIEERQDRLRRQSNSILVNLVRTF